ncbi:MAG: protein-export chaperone SecB, partial [Caulobacteraceae bacterium]
MTDIAPDASNGAVDPAAAPAVRVMTQFTRDLSFENPRAPDSFRSGQPNVDLGVEMNARGRTDGYFEVDLKLTVKS